MTKHKYLLLMLVMSISFFSVAQIRKDARLLYSQLLPVSITTSYHIDQFTNGFGDAEIDYKLKNNGSFALGIDYNFAQTGRFNFKVGIYAKRFANSGILSLDRNVLGTVNNFETELTIPRFWTFHTPLTIEYIRRVTPGLYLSLFAGYDFQFFNYENENRFEVISIEGEERVGVTTIDNSTAIFGGVNFGFGAYFRFEDESFLKFDITWQSRNSARGGQILEVYDQTDSSNNLRSESTFTNEHLAFTIRFAPPYRWFSGNERYKRGI